MTGDAGLIEAVARVLSLRDYNTRIVLLSAAMLGAAAGIVGTFALLRKRALMGDALSHATLPGIVLAFMLSTAWGGGGKSLPLLLTGATVSGLLGLGMLLAIRHGTRIKEDAALGIVLSVMFGVGVALLSVAQRMDAGHSAGLESFIYGKTASMVASDAWLIGVSGAVCAAATALLFKEFRLICFDSGYAQAQGWPVLGLDAALMTLVTALTVVGLQAVGLILVIALLIIPAAAARFWTERAGVMCLAAAAVGAAGSVVGSAASAVWPRLPAGAMVVIALAAAFAVSMVAGPARGVAPRWARHARLARKVQREHLLRAVYEWFERGRALERIEQDPAPLPALQAARSWSPRRFRRAVRLAEGDGLVLRRDGALRLTPRGALEARRITRQHRLWEMYLVTHADIAPSHVDRGADLIEHVLGAEMTRRLERLLDAAPPEPPMPGSPHRLSGAADGGRT